MELFRQAATIMVLGMGLVFLFLALIILLVQGTARLIRRREAPPGEDLPGPPEDGVSGPVVAAIAAALHDRD